MALKEGVKGLELSELEPNVRVKYIPFSTYI